MIVRAIAIGTRGSALALAQARIVAHALERDGRRTRIVTVDTEGDRRVPDTAWGEGAFVAAIERVLLDGRVDLAVHSAKDVPIGQDARLRIAAYLPRADPRDALVLPAGSSVRCLADLPAGTRVGTDSPRRAGFVRAIRPDLVVHPLHGNVDTRLRRLDEGETDALILACAGLDRLGLSGRIAERLAPEIILPAPGQGAIAIQIRFDDGRMLGLAAAIDDRRTRIAVEAERAFLETSGGGCRAPIGALATFDGADLDLIAGHARPDGATAVIARRRGPADDGRTMAVSLATEMLAHRSRVASPSSLFAEDVARADPAVNSGGPGAAPRRRVLIPRPAAQSTELSSALEGFGLEPVVVPAISIEIDPPGADLDRVAGSLHLFRWIVVTSANGARAILTAAERVLTELGSPAWAAIGQATASVLEREGIAVAFQPTVANARTIARELPLDRGDAVLLLRGNLAGDDLAEVLRARGADVDDVVAYRTRVAPASSRLLLTAAVAAGPFDAVILTSGSTVRGLLALAEAEAVDVTAIPAVCIGPETHQAAIVGGFRIVAEAPSRNAHALAATTAAFLAPRPMEIG